MASIGEEVILWGNVLTDSNNPFPRPEVFRSALKIRTLSCGETIAAFVTSDARMYIMNWSSSMSLETAAPRIVDSLRSKAVNIVSCGLGHLACVTEDGEVYTLGANESGQLGAGHTNPSTGADSGGLGIPVRVSVPRAVSVSCGERHTVIVTADGDVYTIGDGRDGRLGHGDERSSNVPTKVRSLSQNGVRVIAAAAGRRHTVALTDHGIVYTWGANDAFQLGRGVAASSPSAQFDPVPGIVASLKDVHVSSICAADASAALADGNLFLWGCGGRRIPERMSCQSRDLRQIAASGVLLCALSGDGRIWLRALIDDHATGATAGEEEISMVWDKKLVQVAASGRRVMALSTSQLPTDRAPSRGAASATGASLQSRNRPNSSVYGGANQELGGTVSSHRPYGIESPARLHGSYHDEDIVSGGGGGGNTQVTVRVRDNNNSHLIDEYGNGRSMSLQTGATQRTGYYGHSSGNNPSHVQVQISSPRDSPTRARVTVSKQHDINNSAGIDLEYNSNSFANATRPTSSGLYTRPVTRSLPPTSANPIPRTEVHISSPRQSPIRARVAVVTGENNGNEQAALRSMTVRLEAAEELRSRAEKDAGNYRQLYEESRLNMDDQIAQWNTLERQLNSALQQSRNDLDETRRDLARAQRDKDDAERANEAKLKSFTQRSTQDLEETQRELNRAQRAAEDARRELIEVEAERRARLREQRELQDTKQKLGEVESKLKLSEQNLEKSRVEASDATDELGLARSDLRKAQRSLDDTVKRLETLERDSSDVEDKLRSQNRGLKDELDKALSDWGRSKEQMENDYREQFDSMRRQLRSLQTELEDKIHDFENREDQLVKEVTTANEACHNLESELQDYKKDNSLLSQQLQETGDSLKQRTTSNDQLKTQILQLSSRVEESERATADALKTARNLTAQLSEAQDRFNESERQFSTTRDRLQSNLDIANGEVSNLRSRLSSRDAELAELEGRVSELGSALSGLTSAYKEKEILMDDMTKKKSELEKQTSFLERRNKELASETKFPVHELAEQRVVAAEANSAKKDSFIQQLEGKLNNQRRDYENQVKMLRDELGSALNSVKEHENLANVLAKDNDSYRIKLEEALIGLNKQSNGAHYSLSPNGGRDRSPPGSPLGNGNNYISSAAIGSNYL